MFRNEKHNTWNKKLTERDSQQNRLVNLKTAIKAIQPETSRKKKSENNEQKLRDPLYNIKWPNRIAFINWSSRKKGDRGRNIKIIQRDNSPKCPKSCKL